MGRSLIKQINDALDHITRVGHSRHQAKEAGKAERFIFSYRTRSTYGDRAIAAVKWIRDNVHPELKELRDLTHDDVRAYLAHCEEQGLAGGSIRSTLAALRKLEHGVRALRWYKAPRPLIPDDLGTATPRSTPRMGFSEGDARRIIDHLEGEAQLVARLAFSAGLRIAEIARLREEDLDRPGQAIAVTNGKGGRSRLVTYLHDAGVIADLPTGRNWLFDNPGGLVRRVERQIARVRDELGIEGGTGRNAHSFRAAYAEKFLRDAIRRGLREDTARDALTQQLGHGRRSVTYRYSPRLLPRGE